MAADLMIPLLVIVIMYILIEAIDSGIVLLCITMLWMPIAAIMANTAFTGGYTELFGGTITATPISLNIIGLMAFTVPLFAIAKLIYMRHVMIGDKETIEGESNE